MNTALYTAEAGFNRSAIMRAAWAYYRQTVVEITATTHRDDVARYLEGEFSKSLRMAWNAAKREKAEAEAAAVVAVIPAAERVARADRLERAAFGIECSDRNGSTLHRVHTMRSEAAQLRAA